MRKFIICLITSIVLLTGLTATAQQTCGKYGTISVSSGQYKLANNVWGANTQQCIQSNGGTAFTVTVSQHNQGSVAAYPSIWKGCH